MDEIKELLARKMMEEDNEELASRFYNVGMDFLLNERCWWCKPEVKEISKEMMYVFSLELNEGDATEKVFRFKRKMEDNLKTCGGCITEYVIGKRELREKYNEKYQEETVKLFFKKIEQWDVYRINKALENRGEGVSQVLCTMYESMYTPGILSTNQRVYRNVIRQLEEMFKTKKSPRMGDKVLSGLIPISVGHSEICRKWARRAIVMSTNEYDIREYYEGIDGGLRDILKEVMLRLSEKEGRDSRVLGQMEINMEDIWAGIKIIIHKSSDNVKKRIAQEMPELFVEVCRGIIRRQSEMEELLVNFEWCLRNMDGQNIWELLAKTLYVNAKDMVITILSSQDLVRGGIQNQPEGSNVQGIFAIPTSSSDKELVQSSKRLKKVIGWAVAFAESVMKSRIEEKEVGDVMEELVRMIYRQWMESSNRGSDRAVFALANIQVVEYIYSKLEGNKKYEQIKRYEENVVQIAKLATRDLEVGRCDVVRWEAERLVTTILTDEMKVIVDKVSGGEFKEIWMMTKVWSYLINRPTNKKIVVRMLEVVSFLCMIEGGNVEFKNFRSKVLKPMQESLYESKAIIIAEASKVNGSMVRILVGADEELSRRVMEIYFGIDALRMMTAIATISTTTTSTSNTATTDTRTATAMGQIVDRLSEDDVREIGGIVEEWVTMVVEKRLEMKRTMLKLSILLRIILDAQTSRISIKVLAQLKETLCRFIEFGVNKLANANKYRQNSWEDETIYSEYSSVEMCRLIQVVVNTFNAARHQEIDIEFLVKVLNKVLEMGTREPSITKGIQTHIGKYFQVVLELYNSIAKHSSTISRAQKTNLQVNLTNIERNVIYMTKYQDNVLVKQIKSHIELQRNKDTTLHFEKPTSSIIEISDDSFKEAKYSIDLQKNAAEMTTSKGKGLGSSGAASININSTFNKIQGGISLLKRKIVEHEKIQENDHGKVRAIHIEKDVENRFEKRYEKEKMKERMRMREMELERERERKAREIETVQSFGRDEWSEELMKRKLEPLKVEVTSESSSESSSDGSSEGSDVENDHKKRKDEKDERDDKKTNGNWKGLLKSMAAESEQQKLEAVRQRINTAGKKRKIEFVKYKGSESNDQLVRTSAGNGIGRRGFLTAEQQAIRDQELLAKRLNPSTSALDEQILQWSLASTGQEVHNRNRSRLAAIPRQFNGIRAYQEAFEPLLVLECFAQIQKALEETDVTTAAEGYVQSRASVDKFQDIWIETNSADAAQWSEADLVLCVDGKSELTNLRGVNVSFYGKVTNIVFAKTKATVTIRTVLESRRMDLLQSLYTNSKWKCLRLHSLTPMYREYTALITIQHLPKNIIAPILMPRQHLRTKDAAVNMQTVRKHMNQYLVNEPQAVAIETVMQNDGFTLVQGPPGTGKTRTILALISLLLASGPKVDSDSGGSTRLLVCAPSNAAVDEIAQRLKMGIVNAQGKVEVPRIVRVGQLESMNSAVRDISLDRLLEEELGNFTLDRKASALNKAADNKGDPRRWSSNKIDPQLSLVYTQYLELTQKQTSIEQRLAQANNEIARLRKEESTTGQLQSSQIAMAIADRKQLSGELSHTRANILASKKSFEALKRRLRNAVLGRAQVVLATLSGSGHESLGVFVTAHRFQCVIVDEASQAVEMSALIPLRYGPTKCVFVGDPNQLPPTVLSLDAGSYGYNQSLFVRMMLNNCDVQLLSIQYRMHPSISYLPSSLFYDRRLLDAENLSVSRSASWHRLAPFFAPLVFFDVDGFEKVGTTINNSSSHSLYNLREAQFAVLLVRCLALLFPGESLFGRIGVITPYKQQLRLLRNQFRNAFGNDVTDGPIDFNTIDGFQGQEKDIILFSCVRAGSSLGFLNDRRRINVAITRAKQSLFIIGNYNALVNASTSTSTSIPSSISDITTKNGGNAINETINGKTNGSGNGNQSHNKQTPYWSTLLTYVRDNSLLIPNARKALLEFARPQKIDLFAKNEPALKNLLNS